MSFIVMMHQSEQLLGGTQIQRVVEVGASTDPSAIYFQFRIPTATFSRAKAQTEADGIEAGIESVLLNEFVTGMSYVQNISPAGQLLDQMEIFWQTTDGTATGSVTILLGQVDPRYADQVIAEAIAPYQ